MGASPNGNYSNDVSRFLLCADQVGPETLFNNKQNQIALHMIYNSSESQAKQWKMCSDRLDYTREPTQSYYALYDLIKSNIRVIVYSGDFDMMVPVEGSMFWLQKMRETYGISIKRSWRPWTRPGPNGDQVLCGMAWELSGLDFYTVTGAGGLAANSQP